MSRRFAVATLLVLVLGGCAVPRWMPFIGDGPAKGPEPPKPATRPKPEAAIVEDRERALIRLDPRVFDRFQPCLGVFHRVGNGHERAEPRDLRVPARCNDGIKIG